MGKRRSRTVAPAVWTIFSATIYQRIYGRTLIVAGIAFNDREPASAIRAHYGEVEISHLATYAPDTTVAQALDQACAVHRVQVA